MPFNRNEPNNDDGTTFYSDVTTYSDTDLENGTIFVPIDRSFNVAFTQVITAESVTVRTQNTDIDVADRNKKGSIQLSSIVQSTKGTTTDALNLRALKATSDPAFTNDEAGTPPVLAKDQTADIEVEMENQPTPINPTTIGETDFFSNFSFKPVVNLASNTTYFFNVTPDVKDSFDKPVSFTVGKGFVTDNTKSVITLSEPILGYRVALRDDFDGTYNEGEVILKKGRSTPTAKIVKQEETSKITYQLELTSFKMNVAYSAANPCTITSTAHGLAVNDVITIYDIVSGTGIKKQRYTVNAVTTDTFDLRDTNTSGFTAGRINYYVNFDNGDIITTDRTDTENIETSIKSIPHEVIGTYEINKHITKVKGSSSGDAFARLIRVNDQTLNYIPMVASDTKEITSTDSFSNNMIIEQETESGTLRAFVSANTSPTNNVHPFHTNAPIVTGFDPDAEASMTPTVRILSLTRDNITATVETNSPHFLSDGDSIVIEGSDQTSYNGTKTITSTPTSNSFTYDVSGSPASPATGKILLKISGSEQATSFGVDFSQSMNTSTITVANNTHIISANGTSATFSGGQNKASSTIQLSYDEFENLVNIASISANTGNSHFDIIPETLINARPYKIRVTTACQDLGSTNTEYTYSPDTTFATGLKLFDPTTGKEVIFKDTEPPEIRKISFSTTGSGDVSGKVLESNTVSEISNPEDLDTASINLNDESIIVQFTESMNTETVTVNTQNTESFGTIQLSCDDFITCVQMEAEPTITTTDNLNDTYTFKPKANLSGNASYVLKVTTGVADESENQNFLVKDNVSRNKIMTLAAEPSAAYTVGEIIKGTGTLTIRANTGTFVEGLTTGEVIVGDTSLAKGKVYDLNVQSSLIKSIRYTEIPSADGKVHPFIPGENITGENGGTASLSNTSITIPPQGKVISYDNSNPYKITYRQINTERAFTAGSSSANDRVVGVSSNSYGKTSVSTDIVGPGIKTTSTAITVDALFRKTDDSIVSISGGNQTGIDIDSNVIIKFNQTMNAESILVDTNKFKPGASDNIILSYDSSFANCIPLETDFSSSNNDTVFEFKPVVLANSSIHLAQNTNMYVKVTQGIKNKDDMNLAAVSTFSGNYANITNDQAFTAIQATVIDDNDDEIELGIGTSGSMPNQTSNVPRSPVITVHFNEKINVSSFEIGSGDDIQLSTSSTFGSGHVSSVDAIRRIGRFGTEFLFIPGSTLHSGTRYYLRIVHTASATNASGVGLTATTYFNSFTTVS